MARSSDTHAGANQAHGRLNAFLDLIQLRPYKPTTSAHHTPSGSTWYESVAKPFKMGNLQDIAYGGCALAMVTASAYQHLEAQDPSNSRNFVCYSCTGFYLRPAFTTMNFICQVTPLRTTRTFQTTEVRIYQFDSQDPSKLNMCLTSTLDFIRRGGARDNSILAFSSQPKLSPREKTLTHHSQLDLDAVAMRKRADRGEIPGELVEIVQSIFGPRGQYTVNKAGPEGVAAQNMWGVDSEAVTTQDALTVPEKTAYDWTKPLGRLRQTAEEAESARVKNGALPISPEAAAASLAIHYLDGALSFSPLTFSHRFLPDAAACASLDFNVRFHQDDVRFGLDVSDQCAANPDDVEGWYLREIRSRVSGWERSYSEATLWRDQGEDQELKAYATMTQCSILRNPERPDSTGAGRDAKL